MKLQTSILPRSDGSVVATGADGAEYVFLADASGDLVCDVEHGDTVILLVRTGNFFPVDPADEQKVMDLIGRPQVEDDEGLLDDPEDPDALPVEGVGAKPTA